MPGGIPIPGLVIPDVNDGSTQQAMQTIQRWAKTVSPRMMTAVEPLVGLQPQPIVGPSAAFLIQAGVQVVTFISGAGALSFIPPAIDGGQPFPNGVLVVELTPMTTGVSLSISSAGSTTSAVNLAATDLTGAPITGPQSVAFLAIGF
jgi:hypothetical protein